MDKVKSEIKFLRGMKDLPHYAERLMDGVEKAIREFREIDISANSLLMINRMFTNRLPF